MPIVDSGTVKYCTECRLKFDPVVSGLKCPNCEARKAAEAAVKPKKVEGKGK